MNITLDADKFGTKLSIDLQRTAMPDDCSKFAHDFVNHLTKIDNEFHYEVMSSMALPSVVGNLGEYKIVRSIDQKRDFKTPVFFVTNFDTKVDIRVVPGHLSLTQEDLELKLRVYFSFLEAAEHEHEPIKD